MSTVRRPARLPIVLFLCAAALAPAAAEDRPKPDTFTATVLQTANMRLPRGGTFQITMNVEQWTSPEERKRLLGVFKKGGSEALMKELRKMKAGYIVPPAFVRWPSWGVEVAASIPQPDGGRIVIVELKLDAKGEGEGATIPAAKLSMNEERLIAIESTPYTTGPQRLLGVREWKK